MPCNNSSYTHKFTVYHLFIFEWDFLIIFLIFFSPFFLLLRSSFSFFLLGKKFFVFFMTCRLLLLLLLLSSSSPGWCLFTDLMKGEASGTRIRANEFPRNWRAWEKNLGMWKYHEDKFPFIFFCLFWYIQNARKVWNNFCGYSHYGQKINNTFKAFNMISY